MRVRIPFEALFFFFFFLTKDFFSRALKRALYFNFVSHCFFSSSVHLLLFLLSFFLNSVLSYFFFNWSFFITFVSFSHIIFYLFIFNYYF